MVTTITVLLIGNLVVHGLLFVLVIAELRRLTVLDRYTLQQEQILEKMQELLESPQPEEAEDPEPAKAVDPSNGQVEEIAQELQEAGWEPEWSISQSCEAVGKEPAGVAFYNVKAAVKLLSDSTVDEKSEA